MIQETVVLDNELLDYTWMCIVVLDVFFSQFCEGSK